MTDDAMVAASIAAHEQGCHVNADTYFGAVCPLCAVTSPIHAVADDPAAVKRVRYLMAEAHDIVAEAIETHIRAKGKRVTAECVLYSGGNDSTILAHLFRDDVDYAVHINTGIGIEETRQFVRDTCAAWDLPLIEEHGENYRELVIAHGFPGPAHHFKMYQRLKERGLRKVRNSLVEHSRRERVVFLAGRRRDESKRRINVPRHERDGAIVWASPLVSWTDDDMRTYREMYPDVPRNPVSDHLHMSGECLCGAFAKPDELEQIRFFFPHVAAEIDALEVEVAAAGHPPARSRWGWGGSKAWRALEGRRAARRDPAPLCSSCTLWTDDELDALAPSISGRSEEPTDG